MPPQVPSSIQDAQRTRVIMDAIVQAGLSARIAFSLVAGLAGQAHGSEDEDVLALAQEAQTAAEGAKNADMTLDMFFTSEDPDLPEALEDAASALKRAAEAYEVAARVHMAMDGAREA